MHYFASSPCKGKGSFSESKTTPGQGFRMRDLVSRMTAGAPPPVGRNPVYIDPKYGVDPLARFDVPIEEMAQLAQNARDRLDMLIAERDAAIAAADANDPAPPSDPVKDPAPPESRMA